MLFRSHCCRYSGQYTIKPAPTHTVKGSVGSTPVSPVPTLSVIATVYIIYFFKFTAILAYVFHILIYIFTRTLKGEVVERDIYKDPQGETVKRDTEEKTTTSVMSSLQLYSMHSIDFSCENKV